MEFRSTTRRDAFVPAAEEGGGASSAKRGRTPDAVGGEGSLCRSRSLSRFSPPSPSSERLHQSSAMESLAASAFSSSRLATHPAQAAAAAVPVRARAVAAGGRRRRSGRGSGGVRCCAGSASAVINGNAAAKAAEEDRQRFFEAAARGSGKGNLVPIWDCIVSDHLTLVLAYRCLVGEDDMDTPSFLFESVEQGLKGTTNVGRCSMIGAHPVMEIVSKEDKVTTMDHEKGTVTEKIVDDPMEVPRSIMEGWHPQQIDDLPGTFSGGWVGFFSYDTVRYVEKKKIPFSGAPQDDRNLPDVHLGLYDDILVFDSVEKVL